MVLAALLAVTLQVSAEEPASAGKTRLIGPPPGTRTDFEAHVLDYKSTEREKKTVEVDFLLTVLRPPAPGDREAVLLVRKKGASKGKEADVLVKVVTLEAKFPQSLGGSGISFGEAYGLEEAVFTFLEGPDPAPPSPWKNAAPEPFAGARFGGAGLCEHAVLKAESPDAFTIQSRMVGKPAKPTLEAPAFTSRWARQITAEKDSLAPLVVTIKVEEAIQPPLGGSKPFRKEFSVRQAARRPLEPGELKDLREELPELKRALLSLQGRITRKREPGGILSLLASGKKEEPLPDPLAAVDAFEKDHPGGLLLPAVRSLRSRLAEWEALVKSAEENRDAKQRSARLVGAAAPAIALKNLDGENVTLESLRGKVVVLVFLDPTDKDRDSALRELRRWSVAYGSGGFEALVVLASKAEGLTGELSKEKVLRCRILPGGAEVARDDYSVRSFPASFLIDREGKVIRRGGFTPAEAAGLEISVREMTAKAEGK
jgi:hypothetical protein